MFCIDLYLRSNDFTHEYDPQTVWVWDYEQRSMNYNEPRLKCSCARKIL